MLPLQAMFRDRQMDRMQHTVSQLPLTCVPKQQAHELLHHPMPVLTPLHIWVPPLQAMFRDRKLNPMQHSVGRLRELLEAHAFWSGPNDRHDFRVPTKRPKKKII